MSLLRKFKKSWVKCNKAIGPMQTKRKNASKLTIIPGVHSEADLAGSAENPPSYTMLLQLEEKIRDLRLAEVGSQVSKEQMFNWKNLEQVSSHLSTVGSSLTRVNDIETIDRTRTDTNNIIEIFEYLGIEAASEAIVGELQATLDGARLEVDSRHLLTVADVMTSER